MRVLVTGGAGFIGSHCVDQLLEAEHQVVVLDIKTLEEAMVNLGHCIDEIDYHSGDIRSVQNVNEAIKGCDAVIHLAAVVSVPLSIEDPLGSFTTNVLGTHQVLEAARLNGNVPVIYASSAAVYGDVKEVPTAETVSLLPLSPYGLHKKHNEEYAQLYAEQYQLPSVGLRFFNVYGERQDPSSPYSGVISIFSDYLRQGKAPTIYGDGEATRDFVYVKDVAKICSHFLQHKKPEALVLNVGTGTALSINEVYRELATLAGRELQPIYASARDGDILHSCSDISLLKEYFADFEPTQFSSGAKSVCK